MGALDMRHDYYKLQIRYQCHLLKHFLFNICLRQAQAAGNKILLAELVEATSLK